MKKTILKSMRIILGGILMLSLFGCMANKYKVDYGGGEVLFQGAKDSYRAGQAVTMYFDGIITDSNYSFYLDNEELDVRYDEKRGFVIEFTMPEHDVELRVEISDNMYMPVAQRECPVCHAFTPHTSTICLSCGSDTEQKAEHSEDAATTCPECGAEIWEGSMFCVECGRNLKHEG